MQTLQPQPSKLMPQSPSSINKFTTCPRQYCAAYVTKEVQFSESEASRYGNRMHVSMHMALTNGVTLPDEFKHLTETVQKVKTWPNLETECELAVDRDGNPVPWYQRYYGSKLDVKSVNVEKKKARVIDWKTGKEREDMTQLHINAICVFAAHPEVEEITVAYAYTQLGKMVPYTIPRTELEFLQNKIQRKIINIQRAHETATFMPSPNGLCKRHCDVRSCEFNLRED